MAKTLHILIASIASPLLLLATVPGRALSQEVGSKGDPIMTLDKRDPEMSAAKAEARRTLPLFLAVLAKPPEGVTEIEFKYPLGGWENIWVGNVRREGNYLTGTLSNEPNQPGHSYGDLVRVPLSEVSDWGYRTPDGKMQGHRTTRVLLGRVSAEQAAPIRAFLGLE